MSVGVLEGIQGNFLDECTSGVFAIMGAEGYTHEWVVWTFLLERRKDAVGKTSRG